MTVTGEFGELLRAFRRRTGWSQEMLAERSGISVRTISVLESGHRPPRLSSVALLATALELNAADSDGLLAAAIGAGTEASTPTGSAAPGAKTFRHLPADVATFTGRDAELKELLDTGVDTGRGATTVVISAIDGMAGIGKTALAVHAGHLLAEKFPDGQLFVALHAHSAGVAPRDPNEALGELLQTLGLDPGAIPPELEARAKVFRNRLAGSRTLIVLDDAASEQQVRPLLPAAPGCLVLVTSRNRLKALDDAHPLPLDVLEPADAIALLRRHIGPDRIAADDPAVARIAELCGYLPLALRITAANLAHRRTWTIDYMEARLRAGLANLTAFNDGDRRVAATFDLSYNNLTPDQQSTFRHLGLIPGSDGDVYATAALLDTGVEEADTLLQDLTDRSLLTETAPGRYRLHDLLRQYARSLATTHDSIGRRETALDRLLHYYAHTAQKASVVIARWPRPVLDSSAPAHAPVLTDPEATRRWLRTEYPNLDAAFRHSHSHELDGHTTALAAGVAEILLCDGPWSRGLQIDQLAEAAARRNNPAAHATILTELGRFKCLTGDYPGATDAQTQALAIYRQIGHRSGEAAVLNELGRVRFMSGDYPEAANAQTLALEISRQIGDRDGEAAALTEIGRVRYLTGFYPEATDALTRALTIYRQIGKYQGEAIVLADLGRVRYLCGDYTAAAKAEEQALKTSRQHGFRQGELTALNILGQVRHATGDYQGATDALTQALEICRQLGNRAGEAYALNVLGQVNYATGDYQASADSQARVLEICRETGDRGGEAYALNFFAAALAALGDHQRGLRLYQQALEVNRELHKPDAEAISLEGIADHYLTAGDLTQGIAYLNQALEIYRCLGMRANSERVMTRLSKLEAK